MKKVRGLMAWFMTFIFLMGSIMGSVISTPAISVNAASVYSFPKVSGGYISSTPESTKSLNVIVFGRPECGNTKYTLSLISNSEWVDDSRINFIYADIDGNDKETVEDFSKNYSSNIIFCYGNNNSAAWDLSGATGSVSLPFTVYIDGNGEVIYSTNGVQTKNQIYERICEVLGEEYVPEEKYTVYTYASNNATEARSMLNMVNNFRTGSDAWYWDVDGNKVYCPGLSKLTYDYHLEKAAMERAKELMLRYSHTRPDGSSFSTAADESLYIYMGENIAYGYSSAENVYMAWREDEEDYSGQGHRRNMLSSDYNAIGIACFECCGRKFWVQEFGYTDFSDSSQTTKVKYPEEISFYEVQGLDSEYSIRNYFTAGDDITISVGEEISDYPQLYIEDFPNGNGGYRIPGHKMYAESYVMVGASDAVELTDNGFVRGVAPGEVQIEVSAYLNSEIYVTDSFKITVEPIHIENAVISLDKYEYDYTGNAIKPNVVVNYDGKLLELNKDYTLTYYDNIDGGEWGISSVIVTGIGNYSGQLAEYFYITKNDSNSGTNGSGSGGSGSGANGTGSGGSGSGANGTGANGTGANGTGSGGSGSGANGTGANGSGSTGNGTGANGSGSTGNGTGTNGSGSTGGYCNEWVNGKWYNAEGICTYSGILSWKCNSVGWWVEDSAGWYPVSSWQKIDGLWYYFNESGYMAANEWRDGCWLSSNGAWEYMGIGMWKCNSKGWWFQDTSGWYAADCWQKINGYWYYFGSDGYMVTNTYIDGYWIGADGVCN
ncbi:MAG: hypothetical protein K6E10_06695 [Eubacterium sp.]|nr:hypothetical protein [Eubacterium sp.]